MKPPVLRYPAPAPTPASVCRLLLDRVEKIAEPDRVYFEWVADTNARHPAYWSGELTERLERYAAVLRPLGVVLSSLTAGVVDHSPVTRHQSRADRTIAADGLAYYVRFERADADAMVAIRQISGAKWEGVRRAYRVPANEASAEAMHRLETAHAFTVCESAERLGEHIREQSTERNAASRAAVASFHVEGLRGTPRPYQQAGIRYLVETRRTLLGDDMGLGKTMEALAAVWKLNAWPAVVVTLASCTYGWQDEAAKWLEDVRVVQWEGRGKGKDKFDSGGVESRHAKTEPDHQCKGMTDAPSSSAQAEIERLAIRGSRSSARPAVNPSNPDPLFDGERILHVINYANLPFRVDQLIALNPQAVIFDESQVLRDSRTKRTLAARKLARRRPVRFALSGTPIENGTPIELLPVLQILGVLDKLGGFHHYTQRWCDAKLKPFSRDFTGWDMSGAAHLPELHERLRATCFLRRTKEQVLPELPRKITVRVPLGMTPEGWQRYETAAKDIAGWLAGKAACDPAWEATVAHLDADAREAARAQRLAEAVERLDGMELLLRLGTLRQVAAEGKLPLAIEWARELCSSRKLVVFAHHKTAVRGLADALRADCGALVIDGATSKEARRDAVKRFQSDPKCRLLTVSLTAGGTGLDGLQHAAQDVAFLEYPWTPSSLSQASSRVHRQGQLGTVHEWHLLARGTVDMQLCELLDAKAEHCDALIDGTVARDKAIATGRALARML